MRTITVYPNGATAGTVSGKTGGDVGKRGKVRGWTPAAARRNVRFLYSVRADRLPAYGIAFTLTLRDCPPTPDAWNRLRLAFIHRLRRQQAVCWHWVTEWQRRGVPHLHGCVFFPPLDTPGSPHTSPADLLCDWLEVARDYGAGPRGQHLRTIDGWRGWALYLARHAARGVAHYQRRPEAVPSQWEGRTGRLWGRGGDWPVEEGLRLEVDDDGFYAFRRLVRRWAIADARRNRDQRALLFARRMLRCNQRELSQVRGISEWIDQDQALLLVAVVGSMGHSVHQ